MNLLLFLVFAQLGMASEVDELRPIVTADGVHRFYYVTKIPDLYRQPPHTADEWIRISLEQLLARHRWCLEGWTIDSVQDAEILKVVEGTCR